MPTVRLRRQSRLDTPYVATTGHLCPLHTHRFALYWSHRVHPRFTDMAGHSHYKNMARHKAIVDAKRGKVFSKLSRYIIIAARAGGGDPNMNLKLRYAIDKARAVSMPKDNIERAVKRGTGELEGVTYDEINYEGYGPGGAAVLVELTTDNRNRTNSEIKKVFEKGGGKIGAPGSVAWMFERKGVILIEAGKTTEDRLMEIALEAGAEDIKAEGSNFAVYC